MQTHGMRDSGVTLGRERGRNVLGGAREGDGWGLWVLTRSGITTLMRRSIF